MSDTMTMSEAARLLGVSNTKIWRLVRDGILPVRRNPLDARQKLVDVEDVERLRAQDKPQRRFISDGIASNPNAVRSDQVEEYLDQHWHRAC